MQKFKGLDYDSNQEVTNKIREFVLQRLKEILKSKISEEYVDMIMIFTSIEYTGDWSNIKDELTEAFEVR